jgi:hypothetical protein
MTDKAELEALAEWQENAGLQNPPTPFTIEYRKTVGGFGGKHEYDWSDKPHRLVHDLCGKIEEDDVTIRALLAENERLLARAEDWRQAVSDAFGQGSQEHGIARDIMAIIRKALQETDNAG